MKLSFDSFTKLLRPSKKTVLLILVVAAVTILLSAIISIWLSRVTNLKVPSIGTIRTFGVEAYGGDIKLKEGEQYIDWGTIYPGTLTNRSFYIRSKSSIEAILNLDTANWTFRDSDGKIVTGPNNNYMSLTWNYTDTPVDPGEVIMVALTLSASSSSSFIDYLMASDVRDFSFDIVIFASEMH